MRMSRPKPWTRTTAGPSPATSYTSRAPGRSRTAVTPLAWRAWSMVMPAWWLAAGDRGIGAHTQSGRGPATHLARRNTQLAGPGAGRSWTAGWPRASPGARRQEHPLRDLAVAETLGDQPEHVRLAFGHAQRAQWSRQVPVAGRARHRRADPAQQGPAGGRDPVVSARGEVRGGFPQPGDRLAPAVGQRRL